MVWDWEKKRKKKLFSRIRSGDRIPADARILLSNGLKIENSDITGQHLNSMFKDTFFILTSVF